jgi:hypothetical protein
LPTIIAVSRKVRNQGGVAVILANRAAAVARPPCPFEGSL